MLTAAARPHVTYRHLLAPFLAPILNANRLPRRNGQLARLQPSARLWGWSSPKGNTQPQPQEEQQQPLSNDTPAGAFSSGWDSTPPAMSSIVNNAQDVEGSDVFQQPAWSTTASDTQTQLWPTAPDSSNDTAQIPPWPTTKLPSDNDTPSHSWLPASLDTAASINPEYSTIPNPLNPNTNEQFGPALRPTTRSFTSPPSPSPSPSPAQPEFYAAPKRRLTKEGVWTTEAHVTDDLSLRQWLAVDPLKEVPVEPKPPPSMPVPGEGMYRSVRKELRGRGEGVIEASLLDRALSSNPVTNKGVEGIKSVEGLEGVEEEAENPFDRDFSPNRKHRRSNTTEATLEYGPEAKKPTLIKRLTGFRPSLIESYEKVNEYASGTLSLRLSRRKENGSSYRPMSRVEENYEEEGDVDVEGRRGQEQSARDKGLREPYVLRRASVEEASVRKGEEMGESVEHTNTSYPTPPPRYTTSSSAGHSSATLGMYGTQGARIEKLRELKERLQQGLEQLENAERTRKTVEEQVEDALGELNRVLGRNDGPFTTEARKEEVKEKEVKGEKETILRPYSTSNTEAQIGHRGRGTISMDDLIAYNEQYMKQTRDEKGGAQFTTQPAGEQQQRQRDVSSPPAIPRRREKTTPPKISRVLSTDPHSLPANSTLTLRHVLTDIPHPEIPPPTINLIETDQYWSTPTLQENRRFVSSGPGEGIQEGWAEVEGPTYDGSQLECANSTLPLPEMERDVQEWSPPEYSITPASISEMKPPGRDSTVEERIGSVLQKQKRLREGKRNDDGSRDRRVNNYSKQFDGGDGEGGKEKGTRMRGQVVYDRAPMKWKAVQNMNFTVLVLKSQLQQLIDRGSSSSGEGESKGEDTKEFLQHEIKWREGIVRKEQRKRMKAQPERDWDLPGVLPKQYAGDWLSQAPGFSTGKARMAIERKREGEGGKGQGAEGEARGEGGGGGV